MTTTQYEHKTLKALSATRTGRRGRRQQDRLMNDMTADGWELVDIKRDRRHDTLAFRRPVGTGERPTPRSAGQLRRDRRNEAQYEWLAARIEDVTGRQVGADQIRRGLIGGVFAVVGILLVVGAFIGPDDTELADAAPSEVSDPVEQEEPVVVPDVVAMGLHQAEDELRAAGLTTVPKDADTAQDRTPWKYSNWLVLGQCPSPGTTLQPGDIVVPLVLKFDELTAATRADAEAGEYQAEADKVC